MATRRTKLLAGATAAVLGCSGLFLYSVLALQGQGTLAQAPLNVQAQIPPAFLMAVDDSGSMSFETLFPGRDGHACWTGTSFFDASGRPATTGTCGYNHLVPYPGHRIDTGRHAIPPVDTFGFARSPEFNPSYFNPSEVYLPWLNGDKTPYGSDASNPEGNASPSATRVDPRNATPTIDMTAVREETGANLRFRALSNMVLPAGTEYWASASCGGLGTTPATRNAWVALDTDTTVTDNCTIGIKYFPAKFYLRTTTAAPAGYRDTVVAANTTGGRSLAPGACGSGCDMYRYEIRPENYIDGADYDAAIQNFANWFSFYGNRNRAMIAGMTRSLVDVQNMRVGYFTINNRVNVTMRDMSAPVEKTQLYDSLLSLPISGSTPNLYAVDHMGAQFKRTDAGAPIKLSCQKNAGMLFTDGYSNQGSPGAPAVTGLGAPFDPTPADSMAAIATKYYQETLRSDAGFPADTVPVPAACSSPSPDPRLDCRNDLHMNFYGVTLGATGNIYDPAVPRNPYVAPFPAWPGHVNDQPSTVDDIWHATINTRGEFINARTPNSITAAMRRVLASVSAGSSPAGSIALTGARIGAGSLTVSPFYEARNNGTDWYSTLTAETVSVAPNTGVVSFAEAWEASAKLPGVRNVWFGRGNAAPQVFNASNLTLDRLCDNPHTGMSLCTGAQIAALGGTDTPATVDDAVAYLTGDRSREVDTNTTGIFRFRTTALGDIVNSTPVVSAPTDDYGYRGMPAPYGTKYTAYLDDKVDDFRPMVYAGANDGMLHAFDGRTGGPGGEERFAFVPQTVLGHMGNLLFPYDPANSGDQKFQHRYYVDGPLVVSDAYYSGDFSTVLVGSTGAGAKGVFALDVSRASAKTATTAASFAAADRLWEISELNTSLTNAERQNIGYVLGRPVVVPVKTGTATGPVRWRAIFGNGYNSTSGKAVLYMVDIGTGAPTITMIEAEETAAPAGSNGLGNVVVADRWGPASDNSLTARSRDGFADTVYAADQKGAIWKFDLRTASPPKQTTPVFTTLRYTSGPEAGTRQPIIGGLTAAVGPGGGVMVYFGTGSFSFEGDPADDSRQSIYAVLDLASGSPTSTITRSSLLEQQVLTTTAGARTTTSNFMNMGHSGWYIDLPVGERFVGYPRVESGILFMPTYAPDSATECTTAGVNWLYGLNALSGGAGLSNVHYDSPDGTTPGANTGAVALDTQGTAPVKDVAVLTSPRVAPLGAAATPAELAAALAAQCSMVIQVAGAPSLYMPRACGRQSWRQLQ